jgi:hypothetical protein
MTLPSERTRAVIHAVDFLTRLISPYNDGGIKRVPKEVRQEALRVLRHFPRPYDLYAAAECAPEVFDAQELWRYDAAQQHKWPANQTPET